MLDLGTIIGNDMTLPFLKNSIWALPHDLTFKKINVTIPANTHFRIPYTRPRGSRYVSVAFIDCPEVDKLATRRAEGRSKRFKMAHAMMTDEELKEAKLISLHPDHEVEYFIRHIKTGRFLYSDQHTAPMFREVKPEEANHFVSRANALVGIVSYMHVRMVSKQCAEKCQWEVVAYNPFGQDVTEVVDICPDWYRAIRFMASGRYHKWFPDRFLSDIRSFANCLPMDGKRLVSFGVLEDMNPDSQDRKYLHTNFDIIHRNDVVGFYSKSDSSLAKIYLGDRIDMWNVS